MTPTTSPLDLISYQPDARTVLSSLVAEAAPARRPRNRRGVVELLWHQREVELTGLLHRVRVPLVGREVPDGMAVELTALLQSWWIGAASLSSTVAVTSVVADLQGTPELGFELVVLVTTDALAGDHSIVNVRMVRDLRRAMRIVRLTTPSLPLAA